VAKSTRGDAANPRLPIASPGYLTAESNQFSRTGIETGRNGLTEKSKGRLIDEQMI
jgi:hypothetical protein